MVRSHCFEFFRFIWVRTKSSDFTAPCLSSLMAIWPKPPIPLHRHDALPVFLCLSSGSKTVIPPQSKGPALSASKSSGREWPIANLHGLYQQSHQHAPRLLQHFHLYTVLADHQYIHHRLGNFQLSNQYRHAVQFVDLGF